MLKKIGWNSMTVIILLLQFIIVQEVISQNIIFLEDKYIVHSQNNYKVRAGKYTPPIAVSFVEKSTATYDTPEHAAISQLSAMQKKDYQWWIECWTESSRAELNQANKQLNRTPEFWINRWSILENKNIELRYRADYEKNMVTYVLIGYALKGFIVGGQDFESVLVYRKEASKWSAAQDLSSDPVFNNILKLWNSSEPVIKIQ